LLTAFTQQTIRGIPKIFVRMHKVQDESKALKLENQARLKGFTAITQSNSVQDVSAFPLCL